MAKPSIIMGLVIMTAIHLAGFPSKALAAKITTLPNGFQVLVEEDSRFPLASIRLFVRAGSAYEAEDEAGISHVLEHMVFKSTQKRAAGEVAKTIEGVGGDLNAGTGFDSTTYKIDVPSDHWSLGLEVLQDMIFGAKLDPEELAQEIKVVLSELDRGEDDQGRILFQSLQPRVWSGSTYARPVIGFRETVSSLNPEKLRDYIYRFYQPQNMLLVVCGKVPSDAVLAKAKVLFGNLRNDHEVTPTRDLSWKLPSGEAVMVRQGAWNKAYLSLAIPIPSFRSEEAPAFEVLAFLLGGDTTSYFYKKYQYEKRLVDDISVSPVMLERSGMLYIQAQLDPEKVEPFWAELSSDLAQLKANRFSEDQLKRARLNLEDSLFKSKETLGGLASKLGYFQFFDQAPAAEKKYIHALRSVTKKDIEGLIQGYFKPGSVCASVLVPQGSQVKAEGLAKTLSERWPGAQSQDEKGVAIAPTVRTSQVHPIGTQGAVVFLPDDTLPYTALSLSWSGGDTLLSKSEQGLAALAARAMPRGTKRRTDPEIQEFLADHVADFDVSAGRDIFSVNMKFPSRFTDELLAFLLEVLSQPSWKSSEISRAKSEQVAEIKERDDQPLGLAFRQMFPFLFGDHPYGYFHLGQPAEVSSTTRDQLRNYWERQRKQPWVMAVCGQYDEKAVLSLAAKIERLGQGTRSTVGEPSWTVKKQLDLTLKERNQAHLLVAFPVPGLTHETSANVSLMREILGGQGGLLFRDLRDNQGLGYSVTAMVWQTPQAGFLAFYIGTTPDKMVQAQEAFQKVVVRLRKDLLPKDEIERAKNLLKGDYFRERQTLLSRSAEASSLMARGLDINLSERLIEQAQALSDKDVRDLALRFLDWDKAYFIRVLP